MGINPATTIDVNIKGALCEPVALDIYAPIAGPKVKQTDAHAGTMPMYRGLLAGL